MTTPQICFRPGDELNAAIAERAGAGLPVGLAAKRDLDRYYHALGAELHAIDLDEPAALLVLDALNGVLHEPWSVPLFWAGIDDAIRLNGLDRKWDVDGPALIARLRALTYSQALAVVDACERAWGLVGAGDARAMREIARAVGLVRDAVRQP